MQLIFVLLLSIAAFGQTHRDPPTNTGNIGSPYASYPNYNETGHGCDNPSATPITTAVGGLLSGEYCVKNNISTATGVETAFSCDGQRNIYFDGGGYDINGLWRVLNANNDCSNLHIFNIGHLTCTAYEENDPGKQRCIDMHSDQYDAVASIFIHHVTVRPQYTGFDNTSIFGAWLPAHSSGLTNGKLFIIDHVDVESARCNVDPIDHCVRSNGIRLQAPHSEVSYSKVRGIGTTWVYQGIVFEAQDQSAHDNYIIMDQLITPDGTSGRAIIHDADETPVNDDCGEDYNNYITVNNQRGYRIRSRQNCKGHDNYFANIVPGYDNLGAVQLYEAGSSANPLTQDYKGVDIYHNTFEMNGGTAFYMRDGYGAAIHDNYEVQAGSNPITGLLAAISVLAGCNIPQCMTNISMARNFVVANPNIIVSPETGSIWPITINECADGVIDTSRCPTDVCTVVPSCGGQKIPSGVKLTSGSVIQ